MVDLGSFSRLGIPRSGAYGSNGPIPLGPNGESLLVQNFNTGFEGNLVLDTANRGTRRVPQQGRCYVLNGTNERVSSGTAIAALSVSTPDTTSFWFKKASAPGIFQQVFNNYIGVNDLYSCIVQTDGTIRFQHATSSASAKGSIGSNASVCDGEWHHIFYTFDGDNTGKLWVDGIAQSGTSGGASGATVGWSLGARTNSTSWLAGEVFDFRVWDSELTASNMTYVLSHGDTGTAPADPVYWLKCDEQSGTIAYNSIGGTNNGTITKATDAFHGTQSVYSFQNQVGFNQSGAVFIPRDESDIANDVLGNPLVNTGKCPQDGNLINSVCADFDGVDDLATVTLTNDTVTNGAFTWEGWINPDTIVGYDTLISIDGALLGFYLKAGKLNLWNGADNLFDTTLSTGTDYHVAVTRDNSNLVTCYINGVAEATTHTITTDRTGTPVLRFANDTQAGTFYDGKLYGWGLYPSALSAAEILYKATDGRQGTAPSVEPYVQYDFAVGEGRTFYDSGSNKLHLTPTGTVTSVFWAGTQNKYHANIKNGFDAGYFFDGSGDHIEYADADSLDVEAADSFSMFVRCTPDASMTGTGVVFGKAASASSATDAGWRFYFTGASRVPVFLIADGTTRAYVSAPVNPAHEVSTYGLSFNRSTNSWTMYKNGVAVSTSVSEGPLSAIGDLSNSVTAKIGESFSGQGFETKFYKNRVLDAAEQLALHNGEDIGATSLQLDADLAALEADTVPDLSGNQPNGTVVGNTAIVRVPVGAGVRPTPSNPAINGHNKAETEINFNPYTTPELANVFNGYASFDGSGDYISCADTGVSALVNSVELDFWRATDVTSATTGEWLVTFYDASVNYVGIALGAATASLTGETVTVLSDGSARSGSSVNIQKGWNKLKIEWNPSIDNYDIYINGYKYNDLIAAFTGTRMNARQITFGSYLNGSSSFFNGRIKNVKIYGTSDQLIRYYPLTSDALDYSGNNHHGTIVNATQPKYTVPTAYSFQDNLGENRNHFKRLQAEGYAKFNGSSSKIDIPNIFKTAAGTVVIDFNIHTLDGTLRALLDIGGTGIDGLVLWASRSGVNLIGLQYGNGVGTSVFSASPTNLNTWYRVVATWDGSNISFYRDGSLVNSATNADLTSVDSYNQWIGSNGGVSRFHDGYINRVYAYDRAKDAAWVTANGTVHTDIVDKEGLIANWTFNKDCKDYSGRYQDGTPTDVTFGDGEKEDRHLLYGEGLEYNSKLPALDSYLGDPREVGTWPDLS